MGQSYKRSRHLALGSLLSALCLCFAFPAFADEQVSAAVHVHSSLSSGKRPISEIAGVAEEYGIDAVVITDLLAERYEYGIRPFEKIIKKTVERDSLLKWGVPRYFQEIEKVNREGRVLMIDGTAVTPFYYWTGNLWPGPLVLNGRAKDFLVIGLGDVKKYENLPVLSNGKSRFTAYDGNQFAEPYQDVIKYVNDEGGLVFWSHPHAHESEQYKGPFGTQIQLFTGEYGEDMFETFDYTGFGVYSAELAQIDTPEFPGLSSANNRWDRLLMEYCRGRRAKPAWAIGEVDYNGAGPGGINKLDSILNILSVKEKTREEILSALAKGHSYLVTTDNESGRLVLSDFFIEDIASGQKARMGETVALTGAAVRIFFDMTGLFPGGDAGKLPALHWILLRNNKIIHEEEAVLPFQLELPDIPPASGKSYYRLIAYLSGTTTALLSNPIFVSRQE